MVVLVVLAFHQILMDLLHLEQEVEGDLDQIQETVALEETVVAVQAHLVIILLEVLDLLIKVAVAVELAPEVEEHLVQVDQV
tara:strand:- start:229 stop:474 length:246 start_codon:yes stop_codon:yes gene_type:complete